MIVDDADAPGVEPSHPGRRGGGLRLVVGDHAAEGPLATLLLTSRKLVAPGEGTCEVDRRRGGRDLEEAGGVRDRLRGARRTGLEIADVRDGARVLRCAAGVCSRANLAPARAAPGTSGVVQVDRAHPHVARPLARVRQRHPRARGDVAAGGATRPAERHAHVDGHTGSGGHAASACGEQQRTGSDGAEASPGTASQRRARRRARS